MTRRAYTHPEQRGVKRLSVRTGKSHRGRCNTCTAEDVMEATWLLPLVYFLFRKEDEVWTQLDD